MEPIDDASRYAWACGVFGLAPGAGSQEVRGAILTHLEEADFAPPPPWRQAIDVLTSAGSLQARPEMGYDAFHEAREGDFAEEVARFGSEFFSLPRGLRRVKWTSLLKQVSAFPRLRATVAAWQPGLEAEPIRAESQNPQDQVLAERIAGLFLLRPAAQEAQRRQWLEMMTGDWQPVVRRVRSKYPKLAELDRDFLAALLSPRRGPAAAKERAELAARTNLAAAFVKTPASPAAARPARSRASAGSGSGSSSKFGAWPIIVVLMIGSNIARMATQQTTPNYHVPATTERYRQNDDILQKYRNTIGSAGRFPYVRPIPDPTRPYTQPPTPFTPMNDAETERFRNLLRIPPAAAKGSSNQTSYLDDALRNRGPWERAAESANAPSVPKPPLLPPVSPNPAGATPAAPAPGLGSRP